MSENRGSPGNGNGGGPGKGFFLSAVAGLAAAAVGIYSVVSATSGSASTTGKTMKAPGKDERMLRADFEKDTAGYFRDLRKK